MKNIIKEQIDTDMQEWANERALEAQTICQGIFKKLGSRKCVEIGMICNTIAGIMIEAAVQQAIALKTDRTQAENNTILTAISIAKQSSEFIVTNKMGVH